MKKALFTLAILVMAFGNMGFAQNKAEMRAKTTERIFKQYGLVRQSSIVPQQANYSEVDGTQHRTTYYYDESELTLSEEVMETYYDNWTNEARALYEYDFNGNILEALMQQWSDGDWEDEIKMSCDYDGDMLSEVIYQYNMGGGVWMNVSKEVYNYNGDTWTVLYWIWNGTTWSSNDLYTYTRSGNIIELLMQYMQGGAWQNQALQTTTFNEEYNISEILTQYWENNVWTNGFLMNYYYNDDLYEMIVESIWDGKGWLENAKSRYTYDDHGNAVTGEFFCKEGGNWDPCYGSLEMAYDYNNEVIEFTGLSFQATYTDLTGVEEDLELNNFTFYPNPVNDVLTIKTDDFQKAEVYSLTGARLTESTSNHIDVSKLSAGMYLLKVYGNETGCKARAFVVR